ncbi:MAG: DUF47 family protein [Thermoanaerobaculia bacterium]|nr:DUF47 family protein [Thermoanaerobaculia bacterium]MCZ7651430.1 DUF47 family protein [Thermoanaerobaculia bacterium]
MRLIPRRAEFFDMLEELAETVCRGAAMLLECFENATTPEEVRVASAAIHEVENAADDICHRIIRELNATFITPLDREDILALATRLDDVLDYVDAVAKRLVSFRISRPTPQALELARIIARGSRSTVEAVRLLRDLRRVEEIRAQCQRLNEYENDGDAVLREALDDLFNGAPRVPLEVIKWKDLYEHLEIATDKCEDVANVIETILVKHA